MAKKQWGTTFDEDTLEDFQELCGQYGLKANTVMEALMQFFLQGNCKVVIEKNGIMVEVKDNAKQTK